MIIPAESTDVPALFHIRTSVRENHLSREQLADLGITEASIAKMISSAPCAWVAASGDDVVAFSGFGAKLLRAAENELFKHHSEIWLETAEESRAAGFYRHLGWGNELRVDDGQIRLTKACP